MAAPGQARTGTHPPPRPSRGEALRPIAAAASLRPRARASGRGLAQASLPVGGGAGERRLFPLPGSLAWVPGIGELGSPALFGAPPPPPPFPPLPPLCCAAAPRRRAQRGERPRPPGVAGVRRGRGAALARRGPSLPPRRRPRARPGPAVRAGRGRGARPRGRASPPPPARGSLPVSTAPRGLHPAAFGGPALGSPSSRRFPSASRPYGEKAF